MKKYFTLICAIILTSPLFAQTVLGGFDWDGIPRTYRLFIPADYEVGDNLPLVLNFHGFTSNAEQQQFYSGMDQVADTANFFVVYPNGVGSAWNVGWDFGSQEDDVGFTNALIDSLHVQYGIDLDRVYSCGMSNGGFFSYKLACDLNDRIAKIASVTGSMVDSEVAFCMPENPIPVMQIHGTNDPVVGYNGTNGVNIPIEDLLENWRDLNGCTAVSDTIFVEDISAFDNSTAQLIQYRDCDDEAIMAFYKIIDGEHTWPGAPIVLGTTNYDFNASVEIWRFFDDQYPQELPVSSEEVLIEKQAISVFPNPFINNLGIYSSREDIHSIRIFNTLGQLVYAKEDLGMKAFQINNIDWHKGFYFIQTKTDSGIKTTKIIKK